jgi:hypothetical protein
MNKSKLIKNEFVGYFRYNNDINELILAYMAKKGGNKGATIRNLLQFVLDMGGIDLVP